LKAVDNYLFRWEQAVAWGDRLSLLVFDAVIKLRYTIREFYSRNFRNGGEIVTGIKRRKNESFEAYMRRVKKIWQQSGKVLQVKKTQYFDAPKSRNMRRKSALHRLSVSEKMSYLKKIGRLPEETFKRKF